jgi:rhodanese-related sulfurtransferase
MKKTFIIFIAVLAAVAITGTGFAQMQSKPAPPPKVQPDSTPNTLGDYESAAARYNWTPAQIKEWLKQPFTQEELDKMGPPLYQLKKEQVLPRHLGNNLTPKQLYENGRSVWYPIMAQYGIGISAAQFKKLWIDQEKWKDPNSVLLDVRNEYEFNQGHIPGAIRLDPGLAYWRMPAQAANQNATYYLQCKAGTQGDGGDRGAILKMQMLDMGYTGPILNITDGFRGWAEQGFPVQNFHGQWTLVKDTFQKVDPYGAEQIKKPGVKHDPWAPTVW